VEDPGLGVEAGHGFVVGDADLAIGERGEALDRLGVAGPHIGGGEDAEGAAAGLAVALEGGAELLDAAELQEGTEEVDAVGGVKLAAEVVEHRLALGVDDEARGVEGGAGALDGGGRRGEEGAEALGEELALVGAEEVGGAVVEGLEEGFGEGEGVEGAVVEVGEGGGDGFAEEGSEGSGDVFFVGEGVALGG